MSVKWMMGSGSIQLTIGLWLLLGQGALAEPLQRRIAEGIAPNTNHTPMPEAAISTGEVPEVNDIDLPATTVDEWLTQIERVERVEITDVWVEETADGFTLRLETTGELAVPETSVTGDAIIADIPNAVLTLAEDNEFFASDPAEGIALINVTNLPNNQVRIAITGTDAPPAIDITTEAAELTVSATPGDPTVQAPDDAIQIVVTGEQDGYFVPNASTATRTDTLLRDIPNSIQVILRQIIEDQQAIAIEEVLENAAGVTFLGNDASRSLNFAIRGFDRAPVLRDGFSLFGGLGTAPEAEVANLERVEVLRGPASVLYGLAEPGGAINLVTKQPLSEPYYNLQFQGGNRNFISPSIDLSGPLTEDGRLLYRLNALYRTEDPFQDYEDSFNRFFIGPTVSWQIGERTDLTVSLEYLEDNDPFIAGGQLAFGDGIADIPQESVLPGNPEDTVEQEYLNVRAIFEHRFSNNWQLLSQFRYDFGSFEYNVFPLPLSLDESTGILNRVFANQLGDNETYSFYNNVQGEFNTGLVAHTLLFGVDVARSENSLEARTDFTNPAFLTPINIFDPDFSAVAAPDVENLPILFGNDTTTTQIGIYLQDQIDLLDNLILVAGLRYDTVDQEVVNVVTGAETNQSDDALTPRIGIVYQPIEPISLYANYSRSFVPNSATDVDSNPLEPEEGEGFEVGVRAELIEGRLAATLAYFDITKQNIATDDPTTALPGSVAVGEQRSRGVDFNLTGEILPGWNIVASYAYIDAEVTEDNTDIVGNRLFGIPEHSASLWTTYEIQSGDLQGLGFGLGFNFVGERQGDLANSFEVDSYFRTNAAVFYRRDNWQLRLNVDNLFDVDYIESTDNNRLAEITPGDPLTVRASLSYTF
ncbi:MAG: TonB-dependent siderophore receptor [Cyanobacteria bacterium J06635_15]